MNVNEYKFKILSSLFTIINIIKIYFRYKFMNKVIFIFFILLTSKTYGNDNLSGNKIICVNDYGSGVKAQALDFVTDTYVNQYADLDSNWSDKPVKYERWYDTSTTTVHIHFFHNGVKLDDYAKNHESYQEIDRRTLEIFYWTDNAKFDVYFEGQCEIYTGENIVEALVIKYTLAKNKLESQNKF